nr:MAG TPA: hypothetical protein [Caudoviricetes sp.]
MYYRRRSVQLHPAYQRVSRTLSSNTSKPL